MRLVTTVELFSTDGGMELPSGEKIQNFEEGGYKYLGIIELDRIKESTMKESFRTEYLRRTKAIMKSRLNGKNKIKAMNTWAVSSMRNGAGIIKWTVAELDEMDRKRQENYDNK